MMVDFLIFSMVIGGLMGALGLMEFLCEKIPLFSRFIDWMVERTMLVDDYDYEDPYDEEYENEFE